MRPEIPGLSGKVPRDLRFVQRCEVPDLGRHLHQHLQSPSARVRATSGAAGESEAEQLREKENEGDPGRERELSGDRGVVLNAFRAAP